WAHRERRRHQVTRARELLYRTGKHAAFCPHRRRTGRRDHHRQRPHRHTLRTPNPPRFPIRKESAMTSPTTPRDPVADHMLTAQNAALLIIDFQPVQVGSIVSMNKRLLVANV